MKASTGSAGPLSPSRRLTYVRNAPSATVEQEKPDTVRQSSDNPTTSGQINRGIIPPKAVESQLSSRRAGSQPPAPLGLRQRPSGAARAPSGHYSPMVMMPPGQNTWDRTRLVRQRLSVLGVVRCRPPKYPLTARHRRSLTLHLSIQRSRWCCSGSPPPVFRSGRHRRSSWTTCRILARSSL